MFLQAGFLRSERGKKKVHLAFLMVYRYNKLIPFIYYQRGLDCVFKKSQGCTLRAYVMTKRLLWARQKIMEGALAGEVSYLCGFKEYSTFYRQYKKIFGVSPKMDIKSNKK